MPKLNKESIGPAIPRAKRGVSSLFGRPRANLHWFDHPQVQAGVAEAEADLLNGRSCRTSSAAETKALFDSWK